MNRKYIFSPVLDFILLGGGSLILFPLVIYLWPVAYIRAHHLYPLFLAVSALLAYALNFPHFFYSYQIIYQDFIKKLNGKIDKSLQLPYIWASIVVPAGLAILIAFCYIKHDLILFGFLANIGLLVNGWHYAKQGFGILIVTSVYQKIYFSAWERRILLWNANVFWVYSWIMINTGMHNLTFWRAKTIALGFPQGIRNIFFYLVCIGAASSVIILIRKYLRESVFPPPSGLVGYATAVYFWLILLDAHSINNVHPVIFMVPAMHALQYITIVVKMKQNEVKHNKITRGSMAIFMGLGIILGYISFRIVPVMLHNTFTDQGLLYQNILFVVIILVFVNIHHFFIDNVIWRKENSETKKYLYDVHGQA